MKPYYGWAMVLLFSHLAQSQRMLMLSDREPGSNCLPLPLLQLTERALARGAWFRRSKLILDSGLALVFSGGGGEGGEGGGVLSGRCQSYTKGGKKDAGGKCIPYTCISWLNAVQLNQTQNKNRDWGNFVSFLLRGLILKLNCRIAWYWSHW